MTSSSTCPSDTAPEPKKRKRTPLNRTPRPATQALWKDPEWVARWRQGFEKYLERRRQDPEKYFRRGVPDGMRKPEAMALWAEARAKARKLMEELEDSGVMPVATPGSEADMAKKALEEAFTMAMSPMRDQVKLSAIKTVLDFTKAKPAQTINNKISNAEDWLKEVVTDLKDSHELGKSA
jgi:hypothetical protein